MSIVMAIHGEDEAPRWTVWDGATTVAPERGFAWFDVVDPEGDDIGRLQRAFGLHELAVEDSMSLAQLAKLDLYADHVFVVAKAAELGPLEIEYTDVSIFLSERRVITACSTGASAGWDGCNPAMPGPGLYGSMTGLPGNAPGPVTLDAEGSSDLRHRVETPGHLKSSSRGQEQE